MSENDVYHAYINSTDTDMDPEQHWKVIKKAADLADYILFGLNFLSIMANFYVFWATRYLFKKSLELTHLLVRSMTTADLLVCIIHQIRTILIRFMSNVYIHPGLFIALMALTWINFSAAGFSLFLLNAEKILYFHYPLQYANYLTYSKTMLAITICWLMCLAYAVLMLASANYSCESGDICIVPNQDIYHMYIVLFCIVPVLSSGILSVYLWFTVKTKRRQTQSQGNLTLRQQLRTMAFIFTSTGFVVLSWVPARVHYILFLEDYNPYALWYGVIANFMLMTSPMIHPFLTVTVYPCYRRLTMKYFTLFRRNNSVRSYRSVKTRDVTEAYL